jgi:hypothetical protein
MLAAQSLSLLTHLQTFRIFVLKTEKCRCERINVTEVINPVNSIGLFKPSEVQKNAILRTSNMAARTISL